LAEDPFFSFSSFNNRFQTFSFFFLLGVKTDVTKKTTPQQQRRRGCVSQLEARRQPKHTTSGTIGTLSFFVVAAVGNANGRFLWLRDEQLGVKEAINDFPPRLRDKGGRTGRNICGFLWKNELASDAGKPRCSSAARQAY